jgi:hypothetical protein
MNQLIASPRAILLVGQNPLNVFVGHILELLIQVLLLEIRVLICGIEHVLFMSIFHISTCLLCRLQDIFESVELGQLEMKLLQYLFLHLLPIHLY